MEMTQTSVDPLAVLGGSTSEITGVGSISYKHNFPSFSMFRCLWESAREQSAHVGYSQYMPVWNNPLLPELNKLRGFDTLKQVLLTYTSFMMGMY